MCGIVGIYNIKNAIDIATKILVLQDIRGKDSTGIAYIKRNKLKVQKKAIAPIDFYKEVNRENTLFLIGHNRNATTNITEKDKDKEAHPFISENKEFAIVHNGHIIGHDTLRESLELLGHNFESGGVDSEVLVHFLEELLSRYKREEAMKRFFSFLEGENVLVLFKDKILYGFPGNSFFKILLLPETKGVVISSTEEGLKGILDMFKDNVIYYFYPEFNKDNQMIRISLDENKNPNLTLWGDFNKIIFKEGSYLYSKEVLCDFCRTRGRCEVIKIGDKEYDRCYKCYKEGKNIPHKNSYGRSIRIETKEEKDDKENKDNRIPLSEIKGKCEFCGSVVSVDKIIYCNRCKTIFCNKCYHSSVVHKCLVERISCD